MVRHLRYFLVVADELHVGHAADRIGIAQPALSQRIRRLEDELDARLFDRTSRGLLLTPAGEVLRSEAQDLLDRFDRVRTQVGRAHRGEIGTLRVGVPPQVSGRALATALDAFGRAEPGLGLDLREAATAEQLRLLADRELDAGLVHQPVDAGELVVGPTVPIPLGVVLPRSSALAGRTEIALADLTGHGLVLAPRAAAPGHYDATLAACRDRGFDPVRVRHAANPELMLGLVLAGEGVAFDSGPVAQKEARVVWRPLAGDELSWQLSVVWPAERPHRAVHDLASALADGLRHDSHLGPEPPGPRRAAVEDPRRGPWTVVNRALHAERHDRAGRPAPG